MKKKKVVFFEGGGYVFTECPSCGGTYSLRLGDVNKVCTPAWCVKKKCDPDGDAEKILKEARKPQDA